MDANILKEHNMGALALFLFRIQIFMQQQPESQ